MQTISEDPLPSELPSKHRKALSEACDHAALRWKFRSLLLHESQEPHPGNIFRIESDQPSYYRRDHGTWQPVVPVGFLQALARYSATQTLGSRV